MAHKADSEIDKMQSKTKDEFFDEAFRMMDHSIGDVFDNWI